MLNLFVSQKNVPDTQAFPSLTAAIKSIPSDTTEEIVITVCPGTYYEKVEVPFSNIKIIGTSADECIITYDDYANMLMEDGSKRGTFRSYTFFVDGDNVLLQNLTIKNSSAPRSAVAQAIALYADGDNIHVKSCRLESYQDTLFTGPLPPKELQKNGFIGPKQYADRRIGHQLYTDCYICGDVDFIFGSAIAYFESCEIASVYSEVLDKPADGSMPVYGYVTAASTYEGCRYGYIFDSCRFTSTCPDGTVYLGRPWRDYAKCVFISCDFGPHIHRDHFHDWNKENARKNCYYAEYNCRGAGAATACASDNEGKSESLIKVLPDTDLSLYTREMVMAYHPHS